MPTDREKIIQRIKKLRAHADSAAQLGSLQEAEAFTAKINELLTEYNLSQFEVDAAETIGRDEFAAWQYTESISYHEAATDYRWRKELVTVICRFNFCWFTYYRRGRTFKVYGNGENVDTVVWLYHYLSIGLMRLAKAAYKADPHGLGQYAFLKSFLYGAVDGLETRLREERASATAAVNALVVYNAQALERYQDLHVKAKTANPTNRPDLAYGVYRAGVNAGKNYTVGGKLNNDKKSSKNIL